MKVFIEKDYINMLETSLDSATLTCTKLSDVQTAFRASTANASFFWEYLKAWAVTTTCVQKSSPKYRDFMAKWNLQTPDFTVTDLSDEKVVMALYNMATEHETQSEFQKAASMLSSCDLAAEYMVVALRQYAIDNNASISEIQRLAHDDPDELLSYIWGTDGYSASEEDSYTDPDCPPCRPELVPPIKG